MAEVETSEVPIPVSKSSPPKNNMARYKKVTTIKDKFKDPLEDLDVRSQVSLETAANRASHKRSFHTGLPRGLPSKKAMGNAQNDPEQLSFLFGGSAKPKLATEKVDVRKEKEKALAWALNEQKKYNVGVLKNDLDNQIQTTVNNVKKEHKDIIADETRQMRRLDKIDQMKTDLDNTKDQVEAQGKTMESLAARASLSFQDFIDARHALRGELNADLDDKNNEMQKLKNVTKAKEAENTNHI